MHAAQNNAYQNQTGKLLKLWQICGSVCIALLIGCTNQAGAPVNVNVAQKTLESTMESWKGGKSPKDLLANKPSIVVQEMDWNDENRLLDYQIVSNDQQAGPNLIATVKLKLGKVDGRVVEKTATYVVGTSPGLTVYRNTMR